MKTYRCLFLILVSVSIAITSCKKEANTNITAEATNKLWIGTYNEINGSLKLVITAGSTGDLVNFSGSFNFKDLEVGSNSIDTWWSDPDHAYDAKLSNGQLDITYYYYGSYMNKYSFKKL